MTHPASAAAIISEQVQRKMYERMVATNSFF
jgi:hypothetical protein